MQTTLAALIETHGLAAVLSTIGDCIRAEAADLEEAGDPADAETVERLERIAGRVVREAGKYELLAQDSFVRQVASEPVIRW